MKVLFFVLIVSFQLSTYAIAQYQSATLPSYTYPPSVMNVNEYCSNTSAYSCGHFVDLTSGIAYDLSVHTWDVGDPGAGWVSTSGFAVIETASGSGGTVNAEDNVVFPSNQKYSIEAVILEESGIPFIFISYYDASASQFMYDLYEWDGTNIIPIITNADVTGTGNNFLFSWIRCDANLAEAIIVAWEDNGTLCSRAGFIRPPLLGGSTYIEWGEYVTLDVNYLGASIQCHNVDVAIQNVHQPLLSGSAYFVYTDLSNRFIECSFSDFFAIYNNVIPGFQILPTSINNVVTTNAFETWEIPKLDAYDLNADLRWAYTVVKTDLSTIGSYSQEVHAVMGIGNLAFVSYILNDGTLGTMGGTLNDISNYIIGVEETKNPVVAFDNNNNDIYFAWYYKNTTNQISGDDQAYIALRVDMFGNVQSNDYLIIQMDPDNTSDFPSISLSTENYRSLEWFLAYTQFDNAVPEYYMDTKNIPWGSTSFRPESPSKITNNIADEKIQIYPNPFSNSFQLSKTNIPIQNEFNIKLFDITGKMLWSNDGNLNCINEQLYSQSKDLNSGIYILQITHNENKQIIKVIKTK